MRSQPLLDLIFLAIWVRLVPLYFPVSFYYILFYVLLFTRSSLGLGSSYGTAKAGIGVCNMGVMRPDLVMKSVIPCLMAGMIGIYGLIIGILIGIRSMLSYEIIVFILPSLCS